MRQTRFTVGPNASQDAAYVSSLVPGPLANCSHSPIKRRTSVMSRSRNPLSPRTLPYTDERCPRGNPRAASSAARVASWKRTARLRALSRTALSSVSIDIRHPLSGWSLPTVPLRSSVYSGTRPPPATTCGGVGWLQAARVRASAARRRPCGSRLAGLRESGSAATE